MLLSIYDRHNWKINKDIWVDESPFSLPHSGLTYTTTFSFFLLFLSLIYFILLFWYFSNVKLLLTNDIAAVKQNHCLYFKFQVHYWKIGQHNLCDLLP